MEICDAQVYFLGLHVTISTKCIDYVEQYVSFNSIYNMTGSL